MATQPSDARLNRFTDELVTAVLVPLRSLRRRYVPLLLVYFAQGTSGLSAIAQSFWVKEQLGLSAEALVALGVWLTVPWTIKMVFGQFVDCVPILGSRRRIYIFIGAGLMASASLLLSLAASGRLGPVAPEVAFITASLLAVVGLVLQDVVADAMSTEVVDRVDAAGDPRPAAAVNAELGMVQVLGRLFLLSGAFVVAGLGGWLAAVLPFHQVFAAALAVPLISVTGALLVRLDATEAGAIDWRILGGGLGFGVFTLAIGIGGVPFGQELVFVVSLAVVTILLRLTVVVVGAETRRTIFFAALLIFAFRAVPGVGPASQWWQIDVLGFDPAFFGALAQIATGLAITGTWLFGGRITKLPITTVLFWLTVITTVMAVPNIALFYGIHEWTERVFGFGPRTIAIVDASLESPFAQLSMVPLLTLIAIYAPPGKRATWFALMASLMNLALSAGGLLSKYLNQVFAIQRGVYDQLGLLMLTVTAIGFVLPVAAVVIVAGRVAKTADPSRSAPGPETAG